MRKCALWAAALLVVGAGTASLYAPPATQPSSAPQTPLNLGPYAQMVPVLSLSDDQAQQVARRYQEMTKAQAEFLKPNQEAWAEAMRDARLADANAVAAGRARVRELQNKFDALTAEHHAKVMAVLTKAQALTWEEKTLIDEVSAKVQPVSVGHGPGGMTAARTPLTDEQTKIVRKRCAEAAKEIQGWPNPYDPARRKEAVEKLAAKIAAEIGPAAPGAPEQ